MHYLLCILLREPDLIREADPLDDILEVWKQFGLPSAMLLRHVNLHAIMCYGAAAFNAAAFHDDNGSVASFLFEAPQSPHDPVLNGEPQEHHRMVLTLVDGAHIELEPLLDATEAILQARAGGDNDLLFVFPVVHVRGFPGAAGPKPRRRASGHRNNH